VPRVSALVCLRTEYPSADNRNTYKGFAISRDLRINQMIRVFDVRVVDEDGSQLGVMRTADALRLAQERGLDLVEVAPLASPPVVRLLDFGQYKYELTKREKEAKRRQRSVTFKEVRLKPKIGVGDFDTKVRRAIEFLEEGDRVKISVQFRGRELTHPQIGRDLLDKFAEQVKEHGVVERLPLLEGKSMHISVASVHKPKVHEPTATAKGHAAAGDNEAPDVDAEEITDSAETPASPAAPTSEPEDGPASNGKVN
jgi:translation initiation factor IF-3